jgi:hypothetical protein
MIKGIVGCIHEDVECESKICIGRHGRNEPEKQTKGKQKMSKRVEELVKGNKQLETR